MDSSLDNDVDVRTGFQILLHFNIFFFFSGVGGDYSYNQRRQTGENVYFVAQVVVTTLIKMFFYVFIGKREG